MSDDTSTVLIFDTDPERVVSVTVGELRKAVTTGWYFNDYGLVHERTCHLKYLPSDSDYADTAHWICSQCGGLVPVYECAGDEAIDHAKFCPNCGARVVSE